MKKSWLIILLLACSGCAFSNLTVQPPPAPRLLGRCDDTSPSITLVVPFKDSRPQQWRCGMQKNGYNMDTANVYCASNPSTYLADLLAAELQSAGFAVHRRAETAPDGALLIEGQLLQFFIEPKVEAFTFNPEADIHIILLATSSLGLRAERDFYVKGTQEALMGAERNFQLAADEATQQIVRNMANAIQELLHRYPELRIPTPRRMMGRTQCS